VESPLKYQHRCVSIFRDKKNAPTGTLGFLGFYWTILVIIESSERVSNIYLVMYGTYVGTGFIDTVLKLVIIISGFALGSVEGRVAIQYVNAANPKVSTKLVPKNISFIAHRNTGTSNVYFFRTTSPSSVTGATVLSTVSRQVSRIIHI
jgi:hypothetical protein